MSNQLHRARAKGSSQLHRHCSYGKYRIRHQKSGQEPHKANRVPYIVSLLGFAMYVLLSIVLAIACFITQNYTMLPIINVMVHELGYIVRHMLESTYARMHEQHSMEKRRRDLLMPLKERIEVTDGSD